MQLTLKQLRAFVLADEVAMRTYRETRDFPKEEVYGLTAQMRRAAVSVPSNISSPPVPRSPR